MTVTEATYGEMILHLSDQLNIISHSIYVSNEYEKWQTVCIMLLAVCAMFTIGFLISRRR